MLSDGDISHAVKVGELKIEPFRENRLTPNGYDLGIPDILTKPGFMDEPGHRQDTNNGKVHREP